VKYDETALARDVVQARGMHQAVRVYSAEAIGYRRYNWHPLAGPFNPVDMSREIYE